MRGPWIAVALALLGCLGPTSASAISGGHPAIGQEFRFVRLILIRWANGNGGSCTGSLISERHVLTAAHCVISEDGQPASALLVKRKLGVIGGMPVAAFHVHADYQRRRVGDQLIFLRNDVAILTLSEPVDGPYGLTPFEFLWKRTGFGTGGSIASARDVRIDEAKTMIGNIMSRDGKGRPYAVHVGFGGFGCDRETRKCKSEPAKPKYIGKYIYNFRLDRTIVQPWCDPSPFDVAAPGENLICNDDREDSTVTPTEHGEGWLYDTEPGDSGGPAIVFDQRKRPFVIGITSFGGSTKSISTNLVEQFEFLRDVESGTGSSFKTYQLRK